MGDMRKSKRDLVSELVAARERIATLESSPNATVVSSARAPHTSTLQELATSIVSRLTNLPPDGLADAIEAAITDLAKALECDRSYVYQVSDLQDDMDILHEWNTDTVERKSEELPRMGSQAFSWSLGKLTDGEAIAVVSMTDLPGEASVERDEWISEETRSLLIVPLLCGTQFVGCMGFDRVWEQREWYESDIALLNVIGECIAGALERRRIEVDLRYRVQLEELVLTIFGAFVREEVSSTVNTIEKALQDLGEFAGVDRCFLFRSHDSMTRFERLHEWRLACDWTLAAGTEFTPFDGVNSFRELLSNLDILNVPDAHDLSTGSDSGKEYLSSVGLRAILCVPFLFAQREIGFVGFAMENEPRLWLDDTVHLLTIASEIFAYALAKKHVIAELDKERQLVGSLMANIPDHIYFKDRDSKFVRISAAQANRFGLADPAEAIGKTDMDFFSPEHANAAYEDEKELMRTGKPVIAKVERETWPDGSVTWVSTTKAPLRDQNGDIVGTFGISRDVTETVKAEQERNSIQTQMQHTQKLQSLGLLAGGIAHDFNNFLMGILGNTGIALNSLTPESPIWDAIKQTETVALRAAELTNQLLAYSGKSAQVAKLLDLTELVREMSHLLDVSIGRPPTYEFDDNLPVVKGDPTQLRQVVMNLITNASDAIGPNGGEVSVRTGVQDCDSATLASCYVGQGKDSGRYVFVEVSDTGSGMTPETLETIFDPFFTTKIKGRGLGLAAVLGIMNAHNGALWVESDIGVGTTFRVYFPCCDGVAENLASDTAVAPADGAGGVALLVDDEEVVRSVTRAILERLNHRVFEAGCGESAIAQYNDHADEMSFVLLDVAMPGTSCKEILTAMKKREDDIPIILMSGYNRDMVAEDLDEGSFDGFIQKPFNADALRDLIADVTSHKGSLASN